MNPKFLDFFKEQHVIKLFFLTLIPICFFYPKYITVFCLSFFAVNIFINLKKTNSVDRNLMFFSVLFFCVMILSAFWSINPKNTLTSSLKIFFIFLPTFLFFQRIEALSNLKEEILNAVYFGMLLTFLIILTNSYFGNFFETIRHLTTDKLLTPIAIILSLFIWPILFFVENKKSSLLKKFLLFAFLLFSLSKTDCDTAFINAALSLTSFFSILLLGNLFLYVSEFILFVGLFFSPIISYFLFKENGVIFNKFIGVCSYIDRINIWNRLSEKIFLAPITGYGFKSSRFLPSERAETISYFKENNEVFTFISKTIPVHPHNFALELWIELGFLGVFIFSGIIFFCFHYMIKIKDIKKKAFYFAFFTSVISTMLYSLSMWQTWWIFTIFLGLCLMNFNENKVSYDQKDLN